MIIRDLEEVDFGPLSRFILDMYSDYPDALWFDSAPSREVLSEIFMRKLYSMGRHDLIDMVAVEGEDIIGECEIVRLSSGTGYVGIIVSKDNRRKGLGSTLLKLSEMSSISMGIQALYAEVKKSNIAALAFFKSAGFVTMPSSEKPDKDLFILSKKLLV